MVPETLGARRDLAIHPKLLILHRRKLNAKKYKLFLFIVIAAVKSDSAKWLNVTNTKQKVQIYVLATLPLN
jgi:hypothetical protein